MGIHPGTGLDADSETGADAGVNDAQSLVVALAPNAGLEDTDNVESTGVGVDTEAGIVNKLELS